MSGIQDFLQAMSNSAASNVSAPIDGINWILGKAGLPVSSTPFLGSDWMQQKGLTRPVQQGAASVAGETASLLSPVIAAAKAPQIAKGLLQGAENLAAPRTMNPQTGAIVWHGSPHKFDKFDSSKIGAGEGAQAYGHGLYLAESPDVAKSYLAAGQSMTAKSRPQEMVARAIDASGGDEKASIQWLQQRLKSSPKEYQGIYSEAISGFDNLKPQSALYKVDLPDEQIARMLDWELPLSQQSNAIQNIARSADIKTAPGSKASGIIKAWREGRDVGVVPKGGDLHHAMTNFGKTEPASFAEMLRNSGIPGIHYLDEGSRNAGKGTSNFVVFPGNEGLLKILERNGAPIK
jgi:hypothetical protein